MEDNYIIYFNSQVSDYFSIPFSNKDYNIMLPAAEILNCPVASWDNDTLKELKRYKEDQELALKGLGVGEWEIL